MGNKASKAQSKQQSKKSNSTTKSRRRSNSLSRSGSVVPRSLGPVAVIGGTSPIGLAITRHLLALGVKDVRMINDPFLFPASPYYDPTSLPSDKVTQTRIPESFSSKWNRNLPTAPTRDASSERLVQILSGVSAVVIPMSCHLDEAPPIAKALYLAMRDADVKYILALSSTAAALAFPTKLSTAACGVENAMSLTRLPHNTGYSVLRHPPILIEDLLYPEQVRLMLKTDRTLLSPSIPARAAITPMSRDDIARAAVALLIAGGKESHPSSSKHNKQTYSITGLKTSLEEVAGIMGAKNGVLVDNGAMSQQLAAGWAAQGYGEEEVRGLIEMCNLFGGDGEGAEEVFRTWIAGKGGCDFSKLTGGGEPNTVREFVDKNVTAFQ